MQADSEACFELLKSCDFGFGHQVLAFSRDDRPDSLLQASREWNTAASRFLHELVAFGPHYLNSEEFAQCLERTVWKYYDFLAASVLQRQRDGFWEYHKRRLKEEGIEFKYTRLAYAFGKKVLNRFTRLQNSQNERCRGL